MRDDAAAARAATCAPRVVALRIFERPWPLRGEAFDKPKVSAKAHEAQWNARNQNLARQSPRLLTTPEQIHYGPRPPPHTLLATLVPTCPQARNEDSSHDQTDSWYGHVQRNSPMSPLSAVVPQRKFTQRNDSPEGTVPREYSSVAASRHCTQTFNSTSILLRRQDFHLVRLVIGKSYIECCKTLIVTLWASGICSSARRLLWNMGISATISAKMRSLRHDVATIRNLISTASSSSSWKCSMMKTN